MGTKILDKYYTPKHIAERCYNKAIEVIGKENISEIIEPSAGNGVFLNIDSSIIGYDIEPEDSRIIKTDYLNLDLPYKQGRLFLGNPPYGRCLNMAQKFYKKSTEIGDYIAFILPISQLNTNKSFYLFDLIYSEDLGIEEYSGIPLHCVFNIYSRPSNCLNQKPNNKLKMLKFCRQDNKKYKNFEYDVRMCYWGDTTAGKILEEEDKSYSGEYKIRVEIEDPIKKTEIVDFIKNYNWNNSVKGIAMKRITQSHILSILREHFDYLE